MTVYFWHYCFEYDNPVASWIRIFSMRPDGGYAINDVSYSLGCRLMAKLLKRGHELYYSPIS